MLNAIFKVATKNNVVTDNPIKYLLPFRRCFEPQTLTFEISGSTNFLMTLESLRPVIDAPRDESKIQPSRHGPQRRPGRRYRKIPLLRPRNRYGTASHLNHIDIYSLFFEETLFLRHKEEPRALTKIGRNSRDSFGSRG
jgi:hypothetical protein